MFANIAFQYANVPTTGTKYPIFYTANFALVGTLMTTNNVNDIFPIQQQQQ